MNVLVVDWTSLAMWNYFVASKRNIEYVAHAIHFVIDELAEMMGMNHLEKGELLLRMLLMGHSLGAHTAGVVGLLVQKNKRRYIGTIVGLDPAGPLFTPLRSTRHCLTHFDAKRVLIVHTSAIFHGTAYRLGHEDYYAGGGSTVIPFSPGLSHMRAANVIRELIWTEATGYICMKPNHVYRDDDLSNPEMIRPIQFRLDLIPGDSPEYISHPIYLPVNWKYPYFNNEPPKRIPAYSIQSTIRPLPSYLFDGRYERWDEIRFKRFNIFIWPWMEGLLKIAT